MEKILEVKNLTVKLDNEIIIDNLSFEVEKKEVFCILGPNGAGKTTLFKALLGLIPFSGKIKWKEGIRIGYLPERLSKMHFSNIPMTVKDFFFIKTKELSKIQEYLKQVGLNPSQILNKNPSQLSGGQFQRFLIAWVFISEPQVLLLDEPTTNVDVSGENFLFNFLAQERDKRNLTILLITHDLDIVYGFATKVLCLYKKALCWGIPRDVLTPQLLEKLYGTKLKFYIHKHD